MSKNQVSIKPPKQREIEIIPPSESDKEDNAENKKSLSPLDKKSGSLKSLSNQVLKS